MTQSRLNCAIYTRKSSDEGLEQSFNSLDAQREACEAYIKSQKHEGWHAIPTLYDDGGFSGGNMDRPALRKLLGDIQAGKVNVVVVYKVDRLTRSLADFAKIVEQFDGQGVSFVSVTQQFNTTSSMGRLTLNVLLSFAQFEREVTGERIRDKVAASKKKGMWMGGTVPLGYVVANKTLVPDAKEAKKVRHIYERYLALGNVRELEVELKRDGIQGKIRTRRKGQKTSGPYLARGALYVMLQNPLYIGRVRHRDQNYQGQHAGIVPEELWNAVQEKLAGNRVDHPGTSRQSQSLLSGLLYNEKNERLSPSATLKDGKRYQYYVDAASGKKLRIPAGELELLVKDKLREHLHEKMPEQQYELHALFHKLIKKIMVYSDRIIIHFKDGNQLSINYRFSTHGRYRQIITDDQSKMVPETQKQALLKVFLQGCIWRKQLFAGEAPSTLAIAKAENKNERYVARLISFSMIAPKLASRILKGEILAHMHAESLTYDLPTLWYQQESILSR